MTSRCRDRSVIRYSYGLYARVSGLLARGVMFELEFTMAEDV